MVVSVDGLVGMNNITVQLDMPVNVLCSMCVSWVFHSLYSIGVASSLKVLTQCFHNPKLLYQLKFVRPILCKTVSLTFHQGKLLKSHATMPPPCMGTRIVYHRVEYCHIWQYFVMIASHGSMN